MVEVSSLRVGVYRRLVLVAPLSRLPDGLPYRLHSGSRWKARALIENPIGSRKKLPSRFSRIRLYCSHEKSIAKRQASGRTEAAV